MSNSRRSSAKPIIPKKAAPIQSRSLFGTIKPSTATVSTKKTKTIVVEDEDDVEELNSEFKAQYKSLYEESVKRMGEPTHFLSPCEVVLRVFDSDDAYGPVTGMTRLERWERSERMGLSPDERIRDIILSNQGAAVRPCFAGV